MGKNRKKGGMTLIEIIVSIAIIAIIAVAFLSMFTYGFKGIIRAGNKSSATFSGASAIDNVIVGNTPDPSLNVTASNVTSSSIDIAIEYPDSLTPSSVVIPVEIVEVISEKNGVSSSVTAFVP